MRLDAADPLREFRFQFEIEEHGPIYLDGNSLGRMPKAVRGIVEQELNRWSNRLVRGWPEGWMEAPIRLGSKIAQLLGAEDDEVLVADSTSINLYKLVVAALAYQPGRRRIVTDALNFPSDIYVLQAAARRFNAELTVVPSQDGFRVHPEEIEVALDEDVALLSLTHCAFKSGALHDMPRLTEAAHRVGALALWDLSHSAGAVPVDLKGCRADLAVGCTYKYLNGGPGAPAFLFVRRELQDSLESTIQGWLGHAAPFEFDPDYRPAPGIRRFRDGTPPILSMLAAEAGIDLLLEAGMDQVRAKSIALTEFLIEIWEARLAPLGVALASPRDSNLRGSHVSLRHPDGLAIDQALIEEKGVIPDFRAPDNIRFGVAPLYNSFSEVAEAMLKFEAVLASESYKRFRGRSVSVT